MRARRGAGRLHVLYGQFRSHEHLFSDGNCEISCGPKSRRWRERPGVPSIFDYAKTEEQRQLMRFIFSSTEFGRPYSSRRRCRRIACSSCARRSRRGEESRVAGRGRESKLDMSYRAPEHLEKLVNQLYDTPPELVEKLKSISPNLR